MVESDVEGSGGYGWVEAEQATRQAKASAVGVPPTELGGGP